MKSLKRTLAAFLAVLMVAFSVPFTASAATTTTAPNVHLAVYDYVIVDGVLYWGPQDESSATEYAMTDTLTANQYYAVAFMVTGMPNFKTLQLDGSYDLNKITPTTVEVKRGKPSVTTDAFGNTVDGQASFIAHMGSTSMVTVTSNGAAISEAGSCMTDNTLLGYNRMYLANLSTSGAELTGQTYIKDGWDGTDYNGCYIDGTLLKLCIITVKEEMTVADLYNAFDFSIAEDQKGRDINGNDFAAVTFGPKGGSDPTPTEDVYTYTFADDSKQEVKVAAGETPTAPANTAATAYAHVADTETHTRTVYSWQADGDKAFKEVGAPDTAACSFKEKTAAIDPVHTQTELKDGATAVKACEACGFEKGGDVIKAEHHFTTTHINATCTVQAHDHLVCSDCGLAKDANFTGDLLAHDYSVPTGNTRGDANCITKGEVEYKCANCDSKTWKEGAYGAHTLTAHAPNDATCTAGGNDAYWTCDVCNKIFADANAATELDAIPTTPVKAHTLTAHDANEATCTEGGNAAYWTCNECNKIFADANAATELDAIPATPAKGHTLTAHDAVEATRAEGGNDAYWTCDECNKIFADANAETELDAIPTTPALGVDIAIMASSLGTATVNGEAVTEKNVPWASSYTLTATPNEGAKFLGWMVNNKIVSEEATYTTSAYADMTYTPVFAEADSTAFTITFVDNYGNVTATVSSDELPLSALPAAPEFAGLTFTGWSKTLEQVNALTASEKVVANYENDKSKTFTVTAQDGATIVVDGVEYTGSTEVTYNTMVTVKADGATSWSANGTVASYDPEYTFYCGSNIEVTFDTVTVDAAPTVAKVSADKGDDFRVKFLATRSIPEGFQLIESGFVYGKAMTEDDLKLGNVGKTINGAKVKQIVCNNKGVDGQFALTYGISAMNANATASAYIIYKEGSETKVAYAYMSFDYNA